MVRGRVVQRRAHEHASGHTSDRMGWTRKLGAGLGRDLGGGFVRNIQPVVVRVD
jgi:hypothetical protein